MKSEPTDDRLTRELLIALRDLRDAAADLHNVTRLLPDERVFAHARLLIDVQAFTAKLKADTEELKR